MGCSCPCGNEYGFDAIGFWVCHKCGTTHDAGTFGHSGKTDPIDPDRADEMVRDGVEFAGRADAALRAHKDSWQAWYALGATYASRGNFMESGLIWTKAAAMMGSDDDLASLMSRAAKCLAGCIIATGMAGTKSNFPYARGLEYLCIHRLGDKVSFCTETYDRICEGIDKVPLRGAFSVRNTAYMLMLERIRILPDMRDHVPVLRKIVDDSDSFAGSRPNSLNPLRRAVRRKTGEFTAYLSEPYRIALWRAEETLRGLGPEEAGKLASLQPDDGSAGFTDRLSRAGNVGSFVAYLKATNAQEAEVKAKEREMNENIDEYTSLYLAGDSAPVEGASVYRG